MAHAEGSITIDRPFNTVFNFIAGPARPTGAYQFEEISNSTRLTFTLHFEPKGLAQLMDPMITSSMKSEIAMLADLKAYLESK